MTIGSEDIALLKSSIERLLAPPTDLTDGEMYLIERLAGDLSANEHHHLAKLAALMCLRMTEHKVVLKAFLYGTKEVLTGQKKRAGDLARYARIQEEMVSLFKDELQERVATKKRHAKDAADALHNQPGGSREKQRLIRKAWASGKHGSRDKCAEKECEALGMSFAAARKALRNTPDPA